MPVSKPAPVKSADKPAVTEVAAGKVASAATQETLQNEEDTGNENDNDKGSNNNEDEDEGSKDDDDDSANDNDAAMDVDSGSLDAKILKTLL
ncbi:hypothetical protein C0995_003186 [Termitomyces sp. Mi166|nr:hypothetical protein C0995_003186 [Termitomyces sp. Mi166\